MRVDTDGYYELECMTMDERDLAQEMGQMIDDLKDVVEIPSGMCRILLHKYKWNLDALLEHYYSEEELDPVAFLKKAHVLPAGDSVPSSSSVSAEGECFICFEEGQLDALACGHTACSHCWKAYLEEKIKDGHSEIECLSNGCGLLIEEEKILAYIREPKIVDLFKRQQVNSYVATSSLHRWCPTNGCEKAVKVREFEHGLVHCTACGNRFCFGCGKECHEPLDCHLLKIWLRKCEDDSETQNWIIANTKDCPKCEAAIEKNGGCNRMVCRKCNFEFCWSCMQNWNVHGYTVNCNKFDDSKNGDAVTDIEKSRAALRKYLHYYNRFANHKQSLKLEKKLKHTIADKMNQLQRAGMSWIDVQFLQQAVEVLSECRRTLMYSYGFAFYLKKDNNYSTMFENNQQDLEMATEQLSEVMERKIVDDDECMKLKQTILNKCGYVNTRRLIILKYCKEGVENGELQFVAQ